MRSKKLVGFLWTLCLTTAAWGQSAPSLTLEDLERMALEKNPTRAQADAAVRAAAGHALQAGLYPNPIMGYMAEELALRDISRTSEHLFFMEQAIVTAGKLKHRRGVFEQERAQAEADAEAQKLRVLNAVRILYYEALGAQEMVKLREGLADLARAADETSRQLFNVGAADRPDVLEAQIEMHQAEIARMEAENDLDRAFRMLAAVVGDPTLPRVELQGNLEGPLPEIDREALLASILGQSPEKKRAEAGVERAKAALRGAKAQPVPDVLLKGGLGYNFELANIVGDRIGPEAFIEVGFRIPLFDRNQGAIAAAEAEVDRSQHEVTRLELELHTRLAVAYDRYRDALELVERYQKEVLPRAQEAYDLYLARFREMGAAYPQVLISQRTLFQVRTSYIESLVDSWQSSVLLRGMLLTGGLDSAVAVPSGETMVRGDASP